MTAAELERFNYSELRIRNNRARRIKELKRNILIFVFTLFLFIVLAITFFSITGSASDGSEETLYKYYKSVEIKPGDTLSALSCEYMSNGYNTEKDLIMDIMYINNIDFSDSLISGCYLIIPYYDTYKG